MVQCSSNAGLRFSWFSRIQWAYISRSWPYFPSNICLLDDICSIYVPQTSSVNRATQEWRVSRSVWSNVWEDLLHCFTSVLTLDLAFSLLCWQLRWLLQEYSRCLALLVHLHEMRMCTALATTIALFTIVCASCICISARNVSFWKSIHVLYNKAISSERMDVREVTESVILNKTRCK